MERTSGVERRGFALAELVAVVVIVVFLAVLAGAAVRRERAAMWDAVDAENLHRFAAATTEYGADNGDRYWTFGWRRNEQYVPDMPAQQTDLNAAVCQAVDILHRKAGREEISVNGLLGAWVPYVFYSQLPLYDYLDQEMPALWGICPADRHRLGWAQDPHGFDEGVFLPCQPTPTGANKRWPYSSSYEVATSFYDQSVVGNRMYQGGAYDLYFTPSGADLYGKLLGETAFPSQKVHLFETDRHHLDEGAAPGCDEARHFYYPDVRTAMLFTDGHSGWMKTSEANPGWQPNNPMSPEPTFLDGSPGVFRWTREFIGGRDFGGPEVGPPP